MATNTGQVGVPAKAHVPAFVAGAGYFFLHFLEMCVVMCLGGITILSLVLRLVGPWLGYPEFRQQLPVVATLFLAIWLTVLMIVWMRIRGHDWNSTLEMASTSVIAFPLLVGASSLGLIAKAGLYPLECGMSCAFMLVPMLLRLDHYAARHGSHQHHAHAAHVEDQHAHHTA